MNAFVGNKGDGQPINPKWRQFIKTSDMPKPTEIFVFLDEHPDSINDGYFLNRASAAGWIDLPGSYHDRSASLSFADGHGEMHHWVVPSTSPPAKPDSARLPFALNQNERTDFIWLMRRTSIYTEEAD